MTALNLLAVQNAPLLRMIATATRHQITTNAGLADALDRDASNVSKSVKALVEAGLLNADPLTNGLTLDGAAQLAAIDRAERPIGAEPGSSLDGGDSRFPWQVTDILALTHPQILPDPNNARRDWTSDDAREDLDKLREDITANGLLQNLVVRRLAPESDKYVLVGGERRWRAIDLAIQEDDWPAERPIPCRLIEVDEVGQRRAALAENLQRRDLNPLEKAQGFEGLAEALIADGMEAAKVNTHIADLIGKTPEHVQQHRRFLQLDDADQQRLTLAKDDPRHLSVRDARQKLANKAAKEEAWKPTNHSVEEQLLLAELLYAARRKGGWLGSIFAIGAQGREDPVARRLADQNIISLSDAPSRYQEPGHYTANFSGWGFSDACRTAWPDLTQDDAEKRLEALKSVQANLIGAPAVDQICVTPWLNTPFDLTPEGQAIVDQNAEEERARRAESDARIAEQEAAKERHRQARTRHLELLNAAAAAAPDDIAAATVETAAEIDKALPWVAWDDGCIRDANGQEITNITEWGRPSEQDLALAQIIVLSVNTAAGLPTPPVKSVDDEDGAEEAATEADEAEDAA